MPDPRATLLLQRQRTLAELKRFRGYLGGTSDRVSDGVGDAADAASDIYEREKTMSTIQRLQSKLAAIDRALQTAERGRYGICEICGERIDPARLEAVPHATTCVGCQAKLEGTLRRGPRATPTLNREHN